MIIQVENNGLINHLIFCFNFRFNYKSFILHPNNPIIIFQSNNVETFCIDGRFNIRDAIYRSQMHEI